MSPLTAMTAKRIGALQCLLQNREAAAREAIRNKTRLDEIACAEPAAEASGDEAAAVLDVELAALRDIATARRRMQAGDYGVCVDCGEVIVLERLMAYPTAVRCVRCQCRVERAFASPHALL